MSFLTNPINIFLFIIAILSGFLLILYDFKYRWQKIISVNETIYLINRYNALIIDLRDNDTYHVNHLPGAHNLPFNKISIKLLKFKYHKNLPIILIDDSNKNILKAKNLFKNAGYSNIFILKGGMLAWQQAGMPFIE